MARQPRSPMIPGETKYQRRIRLARARGLTRQQARGHKPHEHIIRKAREAERVRAKGGYTDSQTAAIRNYAKKIAPLSDTPWQDMAKDMRAYFKGDFSRFQEMRAQRRSWYLERQAAGEILGFGSGFAHPLPDIWMYYGSVA